MPQIILILVVATLFHSISKLWFMTRGRAWFLARCFEEVCSRILLIDYHSILNFKVLYTRLARVLTTLLFTRYVLESYFFFVCTNRLSSSFKFKFSRRGLHARFFKLRAFYEVYSRIFTYSSLVQTNFHFISNFRFLHRTRISFWHSCSLKPIPF
jgi:hypothetical protein